MNEISIGAVGAAAIAGLISLLGLIIGKEQKISEFRQSWIDELRKCFVAYLVNINAISDAIRLKTAGQANDNGGLVKSYQLLNEASHGITLRVNSSEIQSRAVIEAMAEFESIAQNNSTLTPAKIREVERKFIDAAKELLKFEWNRVKRGEKVFVWTKIVVSMTIISLLAVLAYAYTTGNIAGKDKRSDQPGFQLIQVSHS